MINMTWRIGTKAELNFIIIMIISFIMKANNSVAKFLDRLTKCFTIVVLSLYGIIVNLERNEL